MWYTSLIANKEIVKIFESKYPGVTVETYRASGTHLATRVLAEAQSKRYLGDVIETSPPGLMVLRDSQLLLPYTSPYLSEYPEAAKQKATATRSIGRQTASPILASATTRRRLPTADVPKNFDDLLKPALKGKMAISRDDVAARFVGAMIKSKGESFIKKLKDQDVTVHGVNGPGFNELIVSGEVLISFTAIHSNIGHAVDKGASVAWVPMDLVACHLRRRRGFLSRAASLRCVLVARFSPQSRRAKNADRNLQARESSEGLLGSSAGTQRRV